MYQLYPPRYGPEWGSGGIFGLYYHKGTLYYVLSMEAEAFFHHDDDEVMKYNFQLLGPGPASGGDTYNAVDAVDNYIYFGGWIHNPVAYKFRSNGSIEIDFRNKYSHVHAYDIDNKSVKLLWKDSIHCEHKWTGEISQITYDPVNNRLLLARADGHVNLGIYELSRDGAAFKQLSSMPGLKGSLFLDYACFDVQLDWRQGVSGIQCIDLFSGKWLNYTVESWEKISVDGYGVNNRTSGYSISAFAKYYHFFRGGVIVGNPVEPWIDEPRFVRLFDYGLCPYAPSRSNALPVGGGILAVFNSYTHSSLHSEKIGGENIHYNTVVGPTVLVYITPPQARILMALGARVTSTAKKGCEILLGYSTAPNLGSMDATLIDIGYRGVMSISESSLLSQHSPPLIFRINGVDVEDKCFGGIPLLGYSEPKLLIKASKSNKLRVNVYDIGTPPMKLEELSYDITAGKSEVDLSGIKHIASFRLEKPDHASTIYIELT